MIFSFNAPVTTEIYTLSLHDALPIFATIEQTRDFKGLYHVLLGALSPLKGIGPQDIDVGGLLERVRAGSIREVIIATNPNEIGRASCRERGTMCMVES